MKRKSNRPLSAQQRLFAEVYASGKSQTEAYRAAYPKAKRNDAAAYAHASRLLRNGKVSAYVKELQEAARCAAVATRQEVLEYHTAVLRTPIGEVSPSSPLCQSHEATERSERVTMPSKLAAAQELAKMEGWYAADKVELAGKNGADLIPARDLSNADQLATIAAAIAAARARIDDQN